LGRFGSVILVDGTGVRSLRHVHGDRVVQRPDALDTEEAEGDSADLFYSTNGHVLPPGVDCDLRWHADGDFLRYTWLIEDLPGDGGGKETGNNYPELPRGGLEGDPSIESCFLVWSVACLAHFMNFDAREQARRSCPARIESRSRRTTRSQGRKSRRGSTTSPVA